MLVDTQAISSKPACVVFGINTVKLLKGLNVTICQRNAYSILQLFLRRHNLSHMVHKHDKQSIRPHERAGGKNLKFKAKRHRQPISKGILRPVMVCSLPSASGWTFAASGFHLNVYQERSLGWEARIWYHRSDITSLLKFNFLGKCFP